MGRGSRGGQGRELGTEELCREDCPAFTLRDLLYAAGTAEARHREHKEQRGAQGEHAQQDQTAMQERVPGVAQGQHTGDSAGKKQAPWEQEEAGGATAEVNLQLYRGPMRWTRPHRAL